MSSQVQKFTFNLPYTAVITGDVIQLTTSVSHYLVTGDVVQLTDNQGRVVNKPVTVINGTTFDITTNNAESFVNGVVNISTFNTGFIGRVIGNLNQSSGAAAVVQSFVSGAGGAVYTLDLSLDGVHWVVGQTVTHASANGDVQSQTILPAWAYCSINITSIGVNTKLEALY